MRGDGDEKENERRGPGKVKDWDVVRGGKGKERAIVDQIRI